MIARALSWMAADWDWIRRFLGGYPGAVRPSAARSEVRGITLLYLLIHLIILHIMLALALPQWDAWVQREKELELIWRGEQYVQAIMYYHLKFHTYPPNIELLVQQHFLRKKYKDPFDPEGEWNVLTPGALAQQQAALQQARGMGSRSAGGESGKKSSTGARGRTAMGGGVIGVVSKDEGESIIVYKNQHQHNLWQFIYIPQRRQVPRRGPVRPGRRAPGSPGKPAKKPGG